MSTPNINTDMGKFRAALLLAGFFPQSDYILFNDKNKTDRRLKLWMGGVVADAPKKQRELLLGWLSTVFGDRFIEHGWLTGKWPSGYHSFYIRLAL
jgi:hypothetical protein